MQSLKVAMLTYSTRPRGGVVHALKLAERLRALGVDITLYSLARADDSDSMKRYFREVSAPFSIFPYVWHRELITRLENMIDSYVKNLPRDADIYHAQDCVGGSALGRMKGQKMISAPVFRTVHHVDDFAEPRLFEFEKQAVAHSEHIFVVSKYWHNVLKRDYAHESVIAYNGLDSSDFQPLPDRRSEVPTVLFVGGLEPRKGLEDLIRAMELVASGVPSARLIVVAKAGFRGTDQWSGYESLAHRLGLTNRIDFHESIDQGTLLGLYSDCDVLALPSRNEGWGLALMEAMACGKPVVATRVGGIPELVENGTEGILVEAGDVKGIADSITRLLHDPALRSRMGRAGMRRVKEFSWDSTAKVVLREYERVLQRA
jgi:glycosyltransferase involved in cell wall biosynthesis